MDCFLHVRLEVSPLRSAQRLVGDMFVAIIANELRRDAQSRGKLRVKPIEIRPDNDAAQIEHDGLDHNGRKLARRQLREITQQPREMAGSFSPLRPQRRQRIVS